MKGYFLALLIYSLVILYIVLYVFSFRGIEACMLSGFGISSFGLLRFSDDN